MVAHGERLYDGVGKGTGDRVGQRVDEADGGEGKGEFGGFDERLVGICKALIGRLGDVDLFFTASISQGSRMSGTHRPSSIADA